MTHDEFVGHVQHRAELPSRGAAEAVIRVTLETLGERLQKNAAKHLAAQLPPEIGRHLIGADHFEHLKLEEFYNRVAARENTDSVKAADSVAAVVQTLREAVSPGAIGKLRQQLPIEFQELFVESVLT
jgi:uncharacterized protein (DUF2267 family)